MKITAEQAAWWVGGWALVGVAICLLALPRMKKKPAAADVWKIALGFWVLVALGAFSAALYLRRQRLLAAAPQPRAVPARSSAPRSESIWVDLSDGSPPVVYGLAATPIADGVHLMRLVGISTAGAPIWVTAGERDTIGNTALIYDEESALTAADLLDPYAYLGVLDDETKTLGAYALLSEAAAARSLGIMPVDVAQYLSDLRGAAPLLSA
jgi:hypothetical protein